MKKIVTSKLFWIISIMMLVTMCNYVSNEDVCKRLTGLYHGEDTTELLKWLNEDIVTADSFFITIHPGSKVVQIFNKKKESNFMVDTISYRKMKNLLLNIYTPPNGVSFNKPNKYIRFYYVASFAPNKMGERISVIFVDKKVSPAICEFRATNYPPWHLDKWVYEIKPQWYVLYNTPTYEFIKRCDSLNNIK